MIRPGYYAIYGDPKEYGRKVSLWIGSDTVWPRYLMVYGGGSPRLAKLLYRINVKLKPRAV